MISIVIPTYKESGTIEKLLLHLKNNSAGLIHETIVVDATGCEITKKHVINHGGIFLASEMGRSCQMNAGASIATGEILYFLHADSFPPSSFDKSISECAIGKSPAGCFTMRFDSKHPLLKLFGWFTRFSGNWCRGGDQSLFINKELFHEIGGFNEEFVILEDNEIIPRIKHRTKFNVIQHKLITSARRYQENGVFRLQLLFGLIHFGYRIGISQKSLLNFYRKHVH